MPMIHSQHPEPALQAHRASESGHRSWLFLELPKDSCRIPVGHLLYFCILIMKRALITGVTGQDGSYLAEFLLEKGYEVHGVKRRSSSFNTGRIDHLYADEHGPSPQHLHMHFADLTDASSIFALLRNIAPDEVYNLAAQSHVRVSFDIPEYTADVTALGALHLLKAIRQLGLKQCRLYQASSSEMFGSAPPPQDERTAFHPRSPYACAKLFAHAATINYRESHGIRACSGILFNHESPRRGETFVTRKITRAAAQISLGLLDKVYLGNLDARRDWGYAKEYVAMMWRMLQEDTPQDYVIGTGETHTVQEFAAEAFACVGLDWMDHVGFDVRYQRPAEVDVLMADPGKARQELGWEARTRFRDLVKLMVDADQHRWTELEYCKTRYDRPVMPLCLAVH
jgi:GDPmannose 4,6-dehydratase